MARADVEVSPLLRFVRSAAFPGVLLVACTVAALAAANSPLAAGWHHFWHQDLALRLGDTAVTWSVVHWINDGLMVLFFFFVGLEIKHEVLDGHLQSLRQATLPLAAAAGGMLVPAGIYTALVLVHGAPAAAAGWGIPMATDIAFALGLLALLGERVPGALKVFLASLAIADDLGAVLVIAVFYTAEIAWSYLGLAAVVLALSLATNRLGVRRTWPYIVYGLLLWALFLGSGVHATIAGVALAMTVPARRRLDEREFTCRARVLLDGFDRASNPDPLTNAEQLQLVHQLQCHAADVQAPLQRMAHALHPVVMLFIVPVFALANAGVDVREGLQASLAHPAAQGVFLGLLLGKPAGILAATWLAHRLLRGPLPGQLSWSHLHGAAWLAGIGFTMSLFVNGLAFAEAPVEFQAAKVAILAASFLAGAIGFVILRRLPVPAASRGELGGAAGNG